MNTNDVNDDLGGFEDVVSLLREGPIDLSNDDAPPASLWDSIAGELGVEVSASADAASGFQLREIRPEPIDDASKLAPGAPSAPVISMAEERAKRRWGLSAAIATAAAAAVALVALPLFLSQQDDSAVIAAGELDWIGAEAGDDGAAEVIDADGDLALNLDAEAMAGEGEFLEVWLLDVDEESGEVADLVSLGRWQEGGSYNIADDVDLSRFDVVDVSLEIDDGDDSHGGNSLLRGQLDV